MKISVIGGGSTYTPELALGLAELRGVDLIALHDVDRERLDVVGGFVRRMLERRGARLETRVTPQLDEALEGAGFVLTQIRVGGSQARVLDEAIPSRRGLVGQETTGAGGFAMALRSVPAVVAIAERMRAVAPDAFLVNFTNPAGLVTEAAAGVGVRAVGLCSIPSSVEEGLRELFGAPVEVESFGLNHLSWVRSVRPIADGRPQENRLGEVLATWPEEGDIPRDIVEALGLLPNPYLRFFYSTQRMLDAQRAAPRSRAEEVVELERAALERLRDPGLADLPEELAQRGGSGYAVAAVAFVRSVADDRGDRQVLNVPNDGAVPGFPDDAVLEVPCRVGAKGAEPIRQDAVPEHCLGLMRAVKSYERLTIEAALTGSRQAALLALVSHPLVHDAAAAAPLLEEILAAHAQHLPLFDRSGGDR